MIESIADPIEEEGGENLYAFCENSPSRLFDMLGLACRLLDPTDLGAVKIAYASVLKEMMRQLAEEIKAVRGE